MKNDSGMSQEHLKDYNNNPNPKSIRFNITKGLEPS